MTYTPETAGNSTKKNVLIIALGAVAFLIAVSLAVQFSGAILSLAWNILYAGFFVAVGYSLHAIRASNKRRKSLPSTL